MIIHRLKKSTPYTLTILKPRKFNKRIPLPQISLEKMIFLCHLFFIITGLPDCYHFVLVQIGYQT
jgi:hypothetical protein